MIRVAFTLSRRTDGAGQIEGSNLVVTIGDEILPGLQITNTPLGPELPQTGGNGSVAYIIGGVLLMVSAGMLLLYRKYQRRKEDLASS